MKTDATIPWTTDTSKFQQQLRSPPSIIEPSRQQYTELGLGLFVEDASALFGSFSSTLTMLLPQLAYSASYLNACAHALGSVYRTQCGRDRYTEFDSTAAAAYSTSLRLIRGELKAQPSGSIPLIFACLFLVAVETLRGQPHQALIHSRAAHEMLAQLKKQGSLRPSDQRNVHGENDMEMLFLVRDVHISSFKWDYTTSLTKPGISPSYIPFSDVDTANISLYRTLGACSAWLADVFKLRYFPASHQRSILVEQGRHIAALSMWLEQFSTKLAPREGSSDGSYEHALRMRMTCTSWLIRLSSILDMHETSYDIQASRFEQIVLDAEQITSIGGPREARNNTKFAKERCVLGTGVIEPLFLVAAKYRHTPWRRRAIICLANAGLELPFNGLREAAIARHIVDYELDRSQNATTQNIFHPLPIDSSEQQVSVAPFGILEENRIHGCRIAEHDFIDGANRVMVTFVRYKDAVRTCTCSQTEYNTLFDQECHWKTWQKQIRW